MHISIKNLNAYTVIAFIVLLGGILMYITWGLQYGVWYDIGIYSITIVLVLGGLIGAILSLGIEKKTEENQ
jgi:hypothetical protein